MMSALAIVTNFSPAISFAVAIASSTLPVNVVRGNRPAASSGGGRWVTPTTGAPAGWLSPQPSVRSKSRRPAMIAPQPDMSSCNIGALAASTEKLMLSCALGTTTSPFQYQSNSSAGLSSGWATNPSSDMHMWVSTLVMPVRLGSHHRLIGPAVGIGAFICLARGGLNLVPIIRPPRLVARRKVGPATISPDGAVDQLAKDVGVARVALNV